MNNLIRTLSVTFVMCLTTAVQATNPVWRNHTGDNLWNTVTGGSGFGNWDANPEGSAVTDIFNANSRTTNIVAGFPNGTVFFSRNFTCARFRPGGAAGDANRLLTIAATNLSDVTFTLAGGAAELIDGAGMVQDWTFEGTNNANGAGLKMVIGGNKPIPINTGRTMTLNLPISGAGGLSTTAAGTLVLGGSNTFTGDISVQAGTLRLGHPQGLSFGGPNYGTAVPTTVVSATGTLDLGGQSGVNKIITLNGGGFPGAGAAMINSSGTGSTLPGGVINSLSITAGGELFSYPVSVSITGGGGSGAAATASLGLTSASISIGDGGTGYTTAPSVGFSGGGASQQAQATATISGGVVTAITITNPGRGYTSAPTIAITGGGGTGATATANAENFTVVGATVTDGGSGYTSQPAIDFTGGDGGLAAATANFASVILAANIASIGGSGSITINSVVSSSGSGALTKTGSGVLTLTAANTYTGGTTISGGTLLANNSSGSATGSGAVTINGGTLGGTGTVTGAVTGNTGGSVGAGASAGILTLAGGLNLSGGGTNIWELAALKDDSDGTGGTDFDQLALTGGELDLSGDSQLLLKFTDPGLAPYSTNAFWQANHTWTIITLSGGALNTTNLPFSNIANGTWNAGTFSNYVGAGGKIMLTFTAGAPSGPNITSQPQGLTTNQNRAVTFNIGALGTDPMVYHWYFQSEANLVAAGEGVTSYSIPSVQPANEGDYFVIVTNGLGSKTSDVAHLTVIVTPPPTIQPLVGAGTTNVSITWTSVVGAAYQVFYNTNLNSTNWYLFTNLVATGSNITVTDNPPVSVSQRYYRIVGQ